MKLVTTTDGFIKGLSLNIQDGVLKYIQEQHREQKLMCRGCGAVIKMSVGGLSPGCSFSFISELHAYSAMLFMHVMCRKCMDALGKFLQGLNNGKTSEGTTAA